MPETAITFDLEVLEDLHAGTGIGRLGIVDDTQARDQSGHPVVWAATLRGLLREAGEDWLLARKEAGADVDAPDGDRALLHRLLGRATSEDMASEAGAAVVRSLRFHDRGSAAGESLFTVWASTAREVNGRRPRDETLRQVEHAKSGIVFRGEIRVPARQATPEALALLERCLRRLPSVGGGKTRGWGQVRLSAFRAKPLAEPSAAPPDPQADGPARLRLRLTNLEPLNLAATAFAGNVVESQSYIPGSRLRGALLRWFSEKSDDLRKLADTLADPAAMHVGNAYAVPATLLGGEDWAEVSVLPLPLSLEAPKGEYTGQRIEGGDLPWWARPSGGQIHLGARGERDRVAHPPRADEGEGGGEGSGLKRIKAEDYLVRAAGGTTWYRTPPHMGVLMRNQVPTDRLDAGERRGRGEGLFGEHVLWEGQDFLAEVWFANRDFARRFRTAAAPLLDGEEAGRSWLRLGRGGRPVVVRGSAWRGAAAEAPVAPAGHLTLTLTSDLIVRTPRLGFHTDLDLIALRRLIEEATGVAPPTDGLKQELPYVEPTEVYAFNGATGLPRAAAIAVKRGSVFRVAADESEAGRASFRSWRTALGRLNREGTGLGERLAEGFGIFVLDLDIHDPGYEKRDPDQKLKEGDKKRDANWREVVLAKARTFWQEHGERLGRDGPTASQWHSLRARAGAAQPEDKIDDLLDDMDRHAERLAGRAKWGDVLTPLRKQLGVVGTAVAESPLMAKQYFLEQLARMAVARLRSRRKQEEDVR